MMRGVVGNTQTQNTYTIPGGKGRRGVALLPHHVLLNLWCPAIEIHAGLCYAHFCLNLHTFTTIIHTGHTHISSIGEYNTTGKKKNLTSSQ